MQHLRTFSDLLQIELIEDTEAAESAVEHIKAFSSLAISCEGLGGGQDDPILLFQVTFLVALLLLTVSFSQHCVEHLLQHSYGLSA